MTRDVPRLESGYLRTFIQNVFSGLGVAAHDAAVCADVLVAADLRGIDSHGINRCKPIYYDRIRAGILDPVTEFEVARETPATAVVDGHNGMGHAIAQRCMEKAIHKARNCGIAMVVARNSTHFGIAGYYALMAVEEGMIGITGTNARPSTAPTYGVENMLGTNPLTFGMPTDDGFPFLLDCATSVTQRGKIELWDRLGKPIPEGCVIDRAGGTRTDTGGVLEDLTQGKAALLPLGGEGEDLGGHKGYGYAAVVEILSSALQAGNFMKALTGFSAGKRVPIELGHFFIAINVEAFIALEEFQKNTGDILRALRNSEKAPGQDRIYTAGEKEYETLVEREREGIPVPEGVQGDLVAMRDELGLETFRFPWE